MSLLIILKKTKDSVILGVIIIVLLLLVLWIDVKIVKIKEPFATNTNEQKAEVVKESLKTIEEQQNDMYLSEYNKVAANGVKLNQNQNQNYENKKNMAESASQPDEVASISSSNDSNVIVGCATDADCNIFFGEGKNKCQPTTHQCRCETGAGVFCQYGPTTYKDPKDMTVKEKSIFKHMSNYDNFTMQDYKNWLTLYKKDYYLLSDEHLLNLRKVLRGETLSLRDIPTSGIRLPQMSQKYFAEMYDKLHNSEQIMSPVSTKQSDQSNYTKQVGYNYLDYGEFSAPVSMPQQNVVNGEIKRKYRKPSQKSKTLTLPLEDVVEAF